MSVGINDIHTHTYNIVSIPERAAMGRKKSTSPPQCAKMAKLVGVLHDEKSTLEDSSKSNSKVALIYFRTLRK